MLLLSPDVDGQTGQLIRFHFSRPQPSVKRHKQQVPYLWGHPIPIRKDEQDLCQHTWEPLASDSLTLGGFCNSFLTYTPVGATAAHTPKAVWVFIDLVL